MTERTVEKLERAKSYAVASVFGLVGLGNVAVAGGAVPPGQNVAVPAGEPGSIAAGITGFGMLAVACFSAWSTHQSRKWKAAVEDARERAADDYELRLRALEARIAMMKEGFPCESETCPIVDIITNPGRGVKIPQFKVVKPEPEPTKEPANHAET